MNATGTIRTDALQASIVESLKEAIKCLEEKHSPAHADVAVKKAVKELRDLCKLHYGW